MKPFTHKPRLNAKQRRAARKANKVIVDVVPTEEQIRAVHAWMVAKFALPNAVVNYISVEEFIALRDNARIADFNECIAACLKEMAHES